MKYWTKERFLVSGGFIVLKNESGIRIKDGKCYGWMMIEHIYAT